MIARIKSAGPCAWLVAMCVVSASAWSNEEAFPHRPVTVIVPFAAGGGTDIAARLVAEELSLRWKQPVIVMNRPGANGGIGAQAVANSQPDGYTLLVATTGLLQNFAADAPMRIDPFAKFAPVSQLTKSQLGYVISPALQARSMSEFVALLKKPGSSYSYASFGIGSSAHFAGEAFAAGVGVPMVHVPFQGEAAAMPHVMGGQVSSAFLSAGTARQLDRAGSLRMIAVNGRERSKLAPDVPTFAELGYKGLEAIGWIGMFAPNATPPALVEKISRDVASVLSSPAVIGKLVTMAVEPVGSSAAEFDRSLASEFALWQSLSRRFDIKIN